MISTEHITQATILEGARWCIVMDQTHYMYERIGLIKHVSDTGVMVSFHPGTCGLFELLDVEAVRDEDVPWKVKNVHFDLEEA